MVRTRVLAWVAVLGVVAPLTLAATAARAATPAKPYDVNGDGYPELVVGAPNLQVGAVRGAGGVVVLPGSSTGLTLTERIFSQSTTGVPGGSEGGDAFGDTVVSADFDRDGYADLAVGSPGEDRADDFGGEGAVTVLYGSRSGLSGARSVRLTQPSGGTQYATFGAALAVGDLTGDGFVDLAVGSPGAEEVQTGEDIQAQGLVTLVPGSQQGFRTSSARVFRGERGATGYDHAFGSALAIGDVDTDGRPDLVVASAGQGDRDGLGYPGSIATCPGQAGGPVGCRRLLQDDALSGISTVGLAHISGTPRPEIAVAVPWADDDFDPGSVQVLSLAGTTTLSVARRAALTQQASGVPGGTGEGGDRFGADLALADLDRDGYADLAIGVPGETVAGRVDAGRVVVVHGAAGGWRSTGNYSLDQNTPGVPGGAEYPDAFGSAVTLLDHDADGRPDLTVGAPGENARTGAITTLAGAGPGVTTVGSRTFGLATLGYANRAHAEFGAVLGR